MLEETFLRGLVVARDHLQRILSADFKRFTREADRFSRAVRAGTGDHGNAPRGSLNRGLHHRRMFLKGDRRAFA